MKTNLCVTTVVDEKYQYYMPLFMACLNYSYPEYEQKYFFQGKMAQPVRDALSVLDFKYQIVDGLFDEFAKHKYAPISWRFVVPPEYYNGYDYVYITDIDMMLLKEKVSLMDFHVCEMEETDMCYSNSRRNSKHWRGEESLSGLHFADQRWFEKTERARQKYERLLRSGEKGRKREYDGLLLGKMVKESGLCMCKKHKLVPRHHGIHLGNFRLFGSRMHKLETRIDKDKCAKWRAFRCTQVYQEVTRLLMKDEVLQLQLKLLDDFVDKRLV
jgi:hypothetical protein